MPKSTLEDLFGDVCLSLINEPPQPVEPEKSYPAVEIAREIARRRWGMEKKLGMTNRKLEPGTA